MLRVLLLVKRKIIMYCQFETRKTSPTTIIFRQLKWGVIVGYPLKHLSLFHNLINFSITFVVKWPPQILLLLFGEFQAIIIIAKFEYNNGLHASIFIIVCIVAPQFVHDYYMSIYCKR